jgi:cytochrome c-type biogenesis protein CcmF
MIPEFGLFSLIIALGLASVLVLAGFYPRLQPLMRPATFSLSFFIFFSFITLVYCFIQDDFSVAYVAQNANTKLPFIYKLCAVWGGHEGSLLLWVFILSLWTLGLTILSRPIPDPILRRILAVLGAIHIGFLLLLLHTSNPFIRLLPISPTDGADLNPLLQDPGFVMNPPYVYLGYVGFAIPFAFAMAMMLSPKDNFPWTKWARPYALLAFGFLTIGICLGSWWAYYELGWGGWWFWDPVENASFMPWLIGAALVHALKVSSQKPLFSSWSILLALCAFILSLVGTFLVRSGVLSSVHAFASDPARGVFILYFLATVMIGAFGLYLYHLQRAPEAKPMRLVYKESFILLGNVIFVVATATVLLGTLYPLIMEVLMKEKISVGPPYYNAVFVPIMLPLLLIMSLAPYTHWEHDSFKAIGARLWKMALTSLIVLAITGYLVWQQLSVMAFIGILLGTFVIASALYQLKRGFSAVRLGMILAHVGLGVSVLGIALTTALETESEVKLATGEKVTLQGYRISFVGVEDKDGPNYIGKQGHFEIAKDNHVIASLYPEKRFFIAREIMMTETAIDPGFFRDFYIALGERFQDGTWSVRIYIKPFVRWLWLGGLMIAWGACFTAINALRRNHALSFSLRNELNEVSHEFKYIT